MCERANMETSNMSVLGRQTDIHLCVKAEPERLSGIT